MTSEKSAVADTKPISVDEALAAVTGPLLRTLCESTVRHTR